MSANDGLHKRRGVWHYKLRIDGRWRELSTRTRNYQEARKVKQAAVEAHRTNQLPTDLARAPFIKVAEDWLAGRKLIVAAKTYASDKIRLKFVQRSFCSRRLEELVANGGSLIRAYQFSLSTKVGPRTVNMELTVMRQILRSARLWRQVADDVHPLREPSGGPGRALSVEEESRLWQGGPSRPAWWRGALGGGCADTTIHA